MTNQEDKLREIIEVIEDKIADNPSGRLVKEEILEELRDDLQKQQQKEKEVEEP